VQNNKAVINNGRLNPSVSGSRENSKDPKKQKSNNGQGDCITF
jgi:hypothetical protein